MASTSTWHALSSQQTSLPPLLFQYTGTQQGYALCVTDLTSIWTENLSHKEILARAEENNTSIDPSEDQTQFDVFLAKIGEALRGNGGSAALNSGSDADSLELSTSSKLPAPLQPLKWTIYLSKETSSSLTDRLLLPLLRDEAGWESKQRVLCDKLRQKDWVLGKFFDKFEALGVDLGTVFPAAVALRTTKKGNTRNEAAKFIKGLAPFDESAWHRESGEASSENAGIAANILSELLGSSSRSGDIDKLRAPQDKWWDGLQRKSGATSSQSDKNTAKLNESFSPAQNDDLVRASQQDRDLGLDGDGASTASEDEFERQETPPRIRAQRERLAAASSSQSKAKEDQDHRMAEDDASTASEDEFERQETPPRIRARWEKLAASPPQSGTKKDQSPKQIQNRTPEPAPDLEMDAGEATATESEPEPEPEEPEPERQLTPAPAPPPSPPKREEPKTSPKKPTRPRGGMGVIGGRKKREAMEAKQPTPPPPPSPSPPPASSPAPPRKTKIGGRLGMIGGKTKKKESEASSGPAVDRKQDSPDQEDSTHTVEVAKPEDKPAPSREKEKTPPLPPAEETDQQKAARKREELKRQLEEKSKAPKKKRRF
ncbi:hypothetical protein N7454_006264 [Penicillium verhagenii]|nr:hypothetical protein N7454_006264 [Penicillium verhagenii]